MPPPIIELSTIAPSPITPSLFAEAGEAGAAPVLESAIRVPFSYAVAGGGVFEIEEAERREAVPEVLFDVHKVVEHLELAVLLHAAYFELVVEGFCQPHFRVGFCNGVVHERCRSIRRIPRPSLL